MPSADAKGPRPQAAQRNAKKGRGDNPPQRNEKNSDYCEEEKGGKNIDSSRETNVKGGNQQAHGPTASDREADRDRKGSSRGAVKGSCAAPDATASSEGKPIETSQQKDGCNGKGNRQEGGRRSKTEKCDATQGPRKQHCILLVQPATDRATWTYSEHPHLQDTLNHMVATFEQYYQQVAAKAGRRGGGKKGVGHGKSGAAAEAKGEHAEEVEDYAIEDLFAFVDSLHKVQLLVWEGSIGGYRPRGAEWVKDSIYDHLAKLSGA